MYACVYHNTKFNIAPQHTACFIKIRHLGRFLYESAAQLSYVLKSSIKMCNWVISEIEVKRFEFWKEIWLSTSATLAK